jgi:multiple sugar transport system substrate-binding protein
VTEGIFTRRAFLHAASAAAVAATAAACGSGTDKPKPSGTAAKGGASKGSKTLRIAQLSHFVPAYDAWFDNEFTKRWSEQQRVEVIVDHIPFGDASAHAAAEASAGRGHDLFQLTAPAGLEDQVIDHAEIVAELERRFGPLAPPMERTTFNPRTGKRFASPGYYVVNPVLFRADLWADAGARPDAWVDVLRAGPKLRAAGHPLGISLSGDADANDNLLGLMAGHGASLQDEGGNLTINSPATVEAVKLCTAIFKAGMTDEVLNWDSSGSANNRYLASGRASLIENTVSALRAIETQNPALAEHIALAPPPAGPAARLSTTIPWVYVIWQFSKARDTAQQFLVDLAAAAREAFVHSGFFNLPAFPAAVADVPALLAGDPHTPMGKYAVLASAAEWTTNPGQPGYDNAATEEVINQFIVPKMFAAAAQGELTPEEAVRAAEAQMTPIFEKWRKQGKI